MYRIFRIPILFIVTFFIVNFANAQNIEFIPPLILSDLQEADGGSMDLGDIDQDGDLDLVIIGFSTTQGAKTSLYLNDGSGLFIPLENNELVNTYNGKARFIDVNNNGILDLLVIASDNSPFSTASLYMNDGTGQLTLETDAGLRGSRNGDFDFGDVDGDGDLDIIISGNEHYFDGGLINNLFTRLFVNDGTGHFSEEIDSPFTAVSSSDLSFIDLDNDNDLDLILTGKNEDELPSTTLYTNDGFGVFSLLIDHPFENIFGNLSIADCDNDGDEDVMIIGFDSNEEIFNKLYLNDGAGNFSDHLEFDIPESNGAVAQADLDNDGDQDLLLFGLSESSIIGHVYENVGSNEYSLADSMYGSYLSSLVVGDIDGDDDLDFLVSGSSFDPLYPTSRTVRIFFNNFDALTMLADSGFDKLSVHPNPSLDLLRIRAEERLDEIIIFDMLGQVVHKEFIYAVNAQLDIRALTPGAYVLQIKNNTSRKSIRIIKE